MKYTAGQAAKATGVATSTITRALKSGKISGEAQKSGGWLIDPAELHRVFPPVAAQESRKSPTLGLATPDLDSRNSDLPRLLEVLQEQIADLKTDRDHWRDEAQALRRLLPAPTPDVAASGQGKPARGFWARLMGKAPADG
jgi:DNA-binding transcriptional MerR regulator